MIPNLGTSLCACHVVTSFAPAHDVERTEVESGERQAYLQLELEVGTVPDER